MKKQDKCWECGEKVIKKKVDFSVYGVSLGKFLAEVCSKCGEEVFSEEVSDQIDKLAKEKGLWGLESHTKIAKAGDSLIIRVNKRIAEFTGLEKGEEVSVYPESKKKIVIGIP